MYNLRYHAKVRAREGFYLTGGFRTLTASGFSDVKSAQQWAVKTARSFRGQHVKCDYEVWTERDNGAVTYYHTIGRL